MKKLAGIGLALGALVVMSCSTRDEPSNGSTGADPGAADERNEPASPPQPPAKAPDSPVLAKFAALVDEVCACEGNTSCVDAATKKLGELTTANQGFEKTLTPADQTRMLELSGRYDKCIAGRGKEVVAQVEELVDRACACKDAACIDAVQKQMQEMAKALSERGADITANQGRRLSELGQKFASCATEIAGPAEP